MPGVMVGGSFVVITPTEHKLFKDRDKALAFKKRHEPDARMYRVAKSRKGLSQGTTYKIAPPGKAYKIPK